MAGRALELNAFRAVENIGTPLPGFTAGYGFKSPKNSDSCLDWTGRVPKLARKFKARNHWSRL